MATTHPETTLVSRFDVQEAEDAVRALIAAIGEDPNREGLVDSPRRIAAMYRELFEGLEQDPAEETRLTRWIILAWALLLSGFALGCVFWQSSLDIPLIDFALGVMVFAYSGLLGVFLCAN